MSIISDLIDAIDCYDRAIHELPEYDENRVAAERNLTLAIREAKKLDASIEGR